MTNLDSILKSRDITLPTKVRLVKAMVFPAVMYGCESWTVKKAERRRIDAFELWCWRRLLRVPWTARGSNQSILMEISPGISLEGMMLKLKLQYIGYYAAERGMDKKLGFPLDIHSYMSQGEASAALADSCDAGFACSESAEQLMSSGKYMGKQCQTLFFWAPKSLQMVTVAMKLKDAYFLEGKL